MRPGEQIERLAYLLRVRVLRRKFEYLIPVLQANTLDGKSHYERYFFARRFCRAKRVLDIACGAGYGTNILSEVAEKVIGVDRDKNAINYALKHHKKNNVSFVCSSIENFKIDEGAYDVIVCFETLEHLNDDLAFLDSLPKTCLFIFSVPDEKFAWTSVYHRRAYNRKMLEERFGRFNVEYFFQHPNGKIDDSPTNMQNIIGIGASKNP